MRQHRIRVSRARAVEVRDRREGLISVDGTSVADDEAGGGDCASTIADPKPASTASVANVTAMIENHDIRQELSCAERTSVEASFIA